MTIGLLAGALLMAIAAGLIFVAAARSGQFDDVEEAKYQMLRSSFLEEEDHVRTKKEA